MQISAEFADDQEQVFAIEMQPGAPRERQLEEKILAEDASAALSECAANFREIAGYKFSVGKFYCRWDTSQNPHDSAIAVPVTASVITNYSCYYNYKSFEGIT